MRRSMTVIAVLAITSSVMAAPISYEENWNDFTEWTTISGMGTFPTDPSTPPGWPGQSLKCASPGWDSGTTNNLFDGSHWTDIYGTTPSNDVVVPAVSPVTLQTGYRVFSDKACGAVNWEITLSGPVHSVAMRAPGGLGDAGTSDVYEYSIDGSDWADTTVPIIQGVVGQNWWDLPWIEVATDYIKIGAQAVDGNGGLPHPNGTNSQKVVEGGDYSTWGFDTITIKSFDDPTTRAGYLARITLTGGNIVPEPATLALLGFGCLFLRPRRRR